MLGFAKSLGTIAKIMPVVLLLVGASYIYHNSVVSQKETRINQLQSHVDTLNNENVALKSAAEQNKNTIERLEETNREQNIRISNLSRTNNSLLQERDQYLSIFRRHDLTRLSLARPGLIENRINSGTEDVFRTLESETKNDDE